MENIDGEWVFDLAAVRSQVNTGNFAVRPHAMQHAVKEGFPIDSVAQVILRGLVVETYPQRRRCLLYADVVIEGVALPLHVVCEHRTPNAPVDIVTAYIPNAEMWETPIRSRRKR